jgi:hypothetical protein
MILMKCTRALLAIASCLLPAAVSHALPDGSPFAELSQPFRPICGILQTVP